MPTFTAPDGTTLAYRVTGTGEPLVCLPGGPMRDASYLGDLGGLHRHRQLILPDPRGTGASATPADKSSYRCDRQVADVEALRISLGLDRLDLLGHSAGTNLAVLYAARHPDRVGGLTLVTPSTFAVGVTATDEERRAVVEKRRGEPWFAEAFRALQDGHPMDPFFYGRWDARAQAHVAAQVGTRNDEAAAIFGSAGAYEPDDTRAALTMPIRVLAGEVDLNSPPTTVARAFPDADLVVQPGAGHFPWIDDSEQFVRYLG